MGTYIQQQQLIITHPFNMTTEKDNKKIPKSKLYTKTGDSGTSALFNGTRGEKNDLIFEALGTIDELSAQLGVAREYCLLSDSYTASTLASAITDIQSALIDAGGCVATPPDSNEDILKRMVFEEDHVTSLEELIDQLDNKLPKLTNFILPVRKKERKKEKNRNKIK